MERKPMRVAYISNSDSGGQGYLLTKAMRNVLGWDARTIQGGVTYLGYPHDMVTNETPDEEIEKFLRGTDFFIMQDQYAGIDVLKEVVNTKNSCIHGLGTPLRLHLDRQLINQLRLGANIVLPMPDPTITPHLMATAAFESLIVDMETIDKLTEGIERNDEITICCPASKKKEKYIGDLKERIENEGMVFDIVTQTSWEETIKRKAKAHIILDPPSDDVCPSMNTWEALYMGQIPVGPYSAWGYSIHPRLERIGVSYNRDTGQNNGILFALRIAVKRSNENATAMYDAKEYVRSRFRDKDVVMRWYWWMKWLGVVR